MDDEALVAEFNDDPSPASEALIEIVVRVHERYRAWFAATGTITRFRREVRIRSYLAEGWRTTVRDLRAPWVPPGGDPADIIETTLAGFEVLADPLLFNNLVLAYEVARGAEPIPTVVTEAERMAAALVDLADGRIPHDAFVASFGHFALAPYELSEPRFHELDAEVLARIAGMAPRWGEDAKRDLDAVLATRETADVGVLIAVRELARSRALLVVDHLRTALRSAAATADIEDVFAHPIAETLAQLRGLSGSATTTV